MSDVTTIACPLCSSTNVDGIVYGLVPGIEPGQRIGGCDISLEVAQPDRARNACGHEWATPEQVEWHRELQDHHRCRGWFHDAE
jgi:hypothetical protein